MAKPSGHPSGFSERRSAARDAVNRPAKLLDGGHAWECTIADLSATGLRVTGVRGLPLGREVTLVDLATGMGHQGRVVWSKDGQAGVKLSQSRDLRGLTPGAFQAAKAVWEQSQR